MDENLADSITFMPGKDTVSSCHQKTRVPHLLSWKRCVDYVVVEFNNHMLQFNHLENPVKSVMWCLEEDVLISIFTSYTSCQTYSLSSPCPLAFKSEYEEILRVLQVF